MSKHIREPKVQYLSNVHPRVHFCRDAALVRLSGGLEKLVCRDYGEGERDERYDLYLNGVPLAETSIPGCGTCATHLRSGYGDGLMHEEDCLAVRDSLNAGFEGLKKALDSVAPFLGLMKSGLYLVADFDLFPVQNYGSSFDYFWDAPDYTTELHSTHLYIGGEAEYYDAPLYLAPTQRAAGMDPAQVEHYRQRLQEGAAFPRAVALYVNGGVALLLDGHHKAAACAAEGVPVKTLVIFPVEKTEALEAGYTGGKRLYLHQGKGLVVSSGNMLLRDGEGKLLGALSGVKKMKKRPVAAASLENKPWGRVPDAFRTEKFRNFPNPDLLTGGTRIAPEEIRTLISQEMPKAKGTNDHKALALLKAYAGLFPHSKWLSPSERAWLNRSWLEFEFEDVTVLPPDGAEDGE